MFQSATLVHRLAALLCTCALLSVASPAAAQIYAFNKYTVSAGGTNPCGSAAGADLNGDGIPDAVVPDKDTGVISIFDGAGNGGLSAGRSIPGVQGVVQVITANFNHDKCVDIAAFSDTLNQTFIFLNDCHGNFTLKSTLSGNGFRGFGVAVADFNGDGKMDLAMNNNGNNTVSVFLGNGDGSFGTGQASVTGNNPQWISTADFNGDGKQDMAIANFNDGTVSILLGNGDGSFFLKSIVNAGTAPIVIASGDFDNDGKQDLAVADDVNPGTVTILTGNGDGTFTFKETVTVGSDPRWIAAGDLNGDGKLDLVTANSLSNNLSVLLGNDDGTFSASSGLTVGSSGVNGFDLFAVSLADMNHDGKLDLFVTNAFQSTVAILLGNGDGSFAAGSLNTTGTLPDAVTSADFNGDGKPDLAVANELGESVSVFTGNGKGAFTLKSTPSTGQPGPRAIVAGDLNGDGHQDLAVADGNFGGNAVGVLLGNGDGTFAPAVNYSAGQTPQALGIGDFSSDGHPDLAVADMGQPPAVTMLINNGDGTFKAGATLSGFTDPQSVAVGDFNKDGKLDLAVADLVVGASNVFIYLGKGDGTFNQGSTIPFASSDTYSIAAGDFNGDGKLDLAVSDQNRSTGLDLVSTLLGNGDGTFQPEQNFVAPATGNLVIGDFNGDKKVDVAVTDFYDAVSILLGNGDGTLGAYSNYALAPNSAPTGLFAADFNKDGGLDLAVTNNNLNAVTVLLNGAVIALNPGALNFGNQTVGVTSNPLSVTVYNPGAAALQINSLAITGKNAADFAETTSTCGTKLVSGASCTVSMTFTPSATGKRSANLKISDSDKSSPQVVALTGTGT
jgi:hypothetical protein